jgi:hypothetical protein
MVYIPDAKPGAEQPQAAGDNFSESMRCILDSGRINISHIGTPNVPSSEISKRTPPPKKEGK